MLKESWALAAGGVGALGEVPFWMARLLLDLNLNSKFPSPETTPNLSSSYTYPQSCEAQLAETSP